MIHKFLIEYAQSIRDLRRAHPDIIETALAPAFQRLLEQVLPALPTAPSLVVVPEFQKSGVGRPDIALKRAGQPARSFVELKHPDKPADPTRWKTPHDKRQFGRFKTLKSWAASNFAELRRFERDTLVGVATVVPAAALDPATPDAAADKLVAAQDTAGFRELLTQLAVADAPAARSAAELAVNLAHAARLVRATVLDQLAQFAVEKATDRPLQQLRAEFREVLYAHPEAGGYRGEFDTLFSAAFAQTLAFGMLLVREATNTGVDAEAWQHMPPEHPLMKSALRVLSEPEIVEQIGIGFDVLFDTVNSFDPAILAPTPGGRDPILYFYEDFLGTFDPDAKQRYGVYYTPVEVVRYMVGALDRALRDNLGTAGLSDEQVTLLDPATGTGTFLLGIAERVRDDAVAAGGTGMASLALRQLATRMFGFELLIGPYAVAHYRLHHALAEKPVPGSSPPPPLPRLGVYLADTLAEPGTSAPLGKLGWTAAPIRDEREEADRIKREQRVLAIIGNPPYWRFEGVNSRELVGPFVERLWEDFKAPVRDAGWANQLNTFPEFSVAFWRWAIWKLFEADNAPQKGVIAFITNRTFLAGKPYAGLRKMLRERFDRIEVIDLRGDLRRGARAGVTGDESVFNIKVGTAITLAIADGSKPEGALADISYADTWEAGLFSREAKLSWLAGSAAGSTRPDGISIDRGLLDNFKPVPFEVQQWPSIENCFAFRSSRVQTKRDGFVYDASKKVLIDRLKGFKSAAAEEARVQFCSTDARPWSVAQSQPLDESRAAPVAYRPLDQRYLYNVVSFIDRPRPSLQQVWGASNVGLYAMPFGTGEGPAAWCHGLLPDYHAFRGSYGGYAFPLFDRRPGHGPANLSPALLDGLALAYAAPVTAEAAFDAMLALLSATSYTLRFAEDLEDVFPHVPFPADRAVFERAAAIGARIRELETFARAPDPKFLTPSLAHIATTPHGALRAIGPGDWDSGELVLGDNGSGRVTGIPAAVWDFAVSGYRVLPRWLAARAGLSLDLALVNEFRDINGRIHQLIHHFDEADLVLAEALTHSLTRGELGLGPAASECEDGPG